MGGCDPGVFCSCWLFLIMEISIGYFPFFCNTVSPYFTAADKIKSIFHRLED